MIKVGSFASGLALATIFSGAFAYAQQPRAPIQPSLPGTQRFVIYMHPQVRADQYLLDGQTGRCWTTVVDKEGRAWWQEMTRQ